MSELLLEILCEEIPARMQAKAEQDLGANLTEALATAGLEFTHVQTLSGPRRLIVCVAGLPAYSADKIEERKGPKVGAPDAAISGFLRGAGLADVAEAEIVDDPKKGQFYVARKIVKGQAASAIISDLVPIILDGFKWPKSMKTSDRLQRWVRPINRILCILDGQVVPFSWGGIKAGNQTEGHRFFGRGPYTITNFAQYRETLEGAGHVRLEREERARFIQSEAEKICEAFGLNLVPDKELVDELAGLAEWPVVLMGDMDPKFLELPDEAIKLSMRTHQKYLAVNNAQDISLAPHFIVVANIPASDGGVKIKAGNARVLSARLSDAQFFWDQDIATGLEAMGDKLGKITFKQELGSMSDKVKRMEGIAKHLHQHIPCEWRDVQEAVRLCKNDLVSQMVYEFPELQGEMGGYYAREAGYSTDVVAAIAEHYRPQGPSDTVPQSAVSSICALSDKIDSLTCFWAIGQKPTGSKDPFALRRAALGVVRIILENDLRFPLRAVLNTAMGGHDLSDAPEHCIDSLMQFFSDRLGGYLKSEGVTDDRIAAIFSLGLDDLYDIAQRAKALDAFLKTEDGGNLLAGYKRAQNILSRDTGSGFSIDACLFSNAVENELFESLAAIDTPVQQHIKREKYAVAMTTMSRLRAPVDSFFEGVMVNDEDPVIRQNRIALLQLFTQTLATLADFSYIQDQN